MKIPQKFFARQHEIAADYLKELDKHLDDIVSGRATEMFEVRDFAELIHVHPTHLSNTIKSATKSIIIQSGLFTTILYYY